LVENELFGHERAAFTGATQAKPGLLEEAAEGTLFLDEVDSLPSLAQAKLLRFLQDKEFRRLGSNRLRHSDVRVVAASNVDVEDAVARGRLRQDLYYRLNVIPLTLPALRDRREDIPLLAHHFLKKFIQGAHSRATGFTSEALQALMLHDWPGNVRELEHVVHRAVILSSDRLLIELRDFGLPASWRDPGSLSFRQAKARVVAGFEKGYLEQLLATHQGNITQAAQAAGKNRRAFWELLRKYEIDAGQFR
jgi:DNA-binding NtrC family response regulator